MPGRSAFVPDVAFTGEAAGPVTSLQAAFATPGRRTRQKYARSRRRPCLRAERTSTEARVLLQGDLERQRGHFSLSLKKEKQPVNSKR